MNRTEVIKKITDCGLVAVVRAESTDRAEQITEACIEGGVAAIELTFTVPGAHKLIEHMAGRYSKSNEIIIGAGTVLDSETARTAILSGAQYVVSPHLDERIVTLCNRYSVACMPGIFTPTEAVKALELGVDILKVFPGDIATPKFIKALRGPLPQARMMPSGGVSLENVEDWIKAGAVAVGAGGSLTGKAKDGDYAAVTETARLFIEKIRRARGISKI